VINVVTSHGMYQLSVIKFIQRAQTSSLNAIGGATRLDASCPCGGGSSMS